MIPYLVKCQLLFLGDDEDLAKTMIITAMAKTDRHASENNDNDDVDDGMSTMESSPTVALVW